MIEIEFGENAGGKRSFRSSDEIISYLTAQAKAWTNHALSPQSPDGRAQGFTRHLAEPWRQLKTVVATQIQQQPDNVERLVKSLRGSEYFRRAISTTSTLGIGIADVADEHGAQAALGAAKFSDATDGEQVFSNLTKIEIVGAVRLMQHIDVTPSFPPAGIRAGRLFCASARLKQWAA
ncbi:MAG: hypothetical protein ACOY7L_21165 [Pseudomonadota bacterium]